MTKLRCAILDDYQQIALKIADWSSIAEKVDVESFNYHFSNEDEILHAISNHQILVIMRERTPFRASLLERLQNLKLLVTSGMRNASIDLEAATKSGIVVSGTRSLSEPPVELTWALILGLARHIVQENNAFRANGPWQSTVGIDLNGKQLGLLGLGKIGSRVAQIGKAFGMKVIAWSQHLTKEKTDSLGVDLASSKIELLKKSDFVSIHLVLSERTKNLIGAVEFNSMRPTAYLVNTSRAQIMDQAALIDAVKDKKIAGAGLDVFDIEPLPERNQLRSLPNILATPHLGYVTQENYRIYFDEAIEDIKAFLANSPIRRLC